MKHKLFCLLGCFYLSLGLVWAQPLETPTNLTVKLGGDSAQGSWDAVKGASYYEVWTQTFGKWTYDEKDLASSPLTSSFKLDVQDRRTLFKVRAVGPDGEKSEFSDEVVGSETVKETAEDTEDTDYSQPSGGSEFDPKAPPPEPPTSLFAVWNEARVIRLVWQGGSKAVKFTVEEEVEGEWVSVHEISFPKKNTALIEGRPMPGPYKFRVRAIGKNGRASEPSRATTARR